MADREFLLRIVGDVSSAQQSLQNLEGTANNFQTGMRRVGTAVAGYFAFDAVKDFGLAVINGASDQEQAVGAATSVFKEYSDEITAFSENTAKTMGLSKTQFLELSTVTGALLKNAGVPLNEVTDSATMLTERAADLAAMFGGPVDEAMAAINSGLKGELDPLERFGVSLKASTVDARAAAMGYVDADGKVTDYGRSLARVDLIMEQSADAAGTFARESDSLAGQQAILQAQFADLQADLGKKLLPVVVKIANAFVGLIEFISRNQSWIVPLVGGIAAFVAAIKGAQIAMAAFNLVMAANPIVLVVAAIAAAVAGFILLYQKVQWFRDAVDAVIDVFQALWDIILVGFDWIRKNWPLLLAILTGPFGLAVLAITRNWDTILNFFRELPGRVRSFLGTIWSIITQPFQTAKDHVTRTLDGIADWFYRLPGRIQGFFRGVADVITYPFRTAFDAIKRLWNNTVGGFGFSVPSWVPGVGGKSFRIPEMATGGIVTRPTIALIGEAGPEAVIPLSRAGGMVGSPITINVYTLEATAETGRLIANSLREYERTNGKFGG